MAILIEGYSFVFLDQITFQRRKKYYPFFDARLIVSQIQYIWCLSIIKKYNQLESYD